MNTVISTTLISVLGAGLIGMLFHYLRDLSTRFASLEQAVNNLDTKVTGAIKDLESNVTGAIKDLETNVTVELKAVETQFEGHG
ncbi:hypothetical protein [Candidatus Poriferisocius sp.]|uniref:hypothetical protein n=1 Tax=Candidatus Poriferisocius sp. TaxID=3101276 RepID=UPI003B014692